MQKFKGKVIWITGASSGVGKEMALQSSSLGAFVVLSSRKESLLLEVQKQLAHPENSLVLPLDVSDLDAMSDKVKQVIAKFKKIDILFNNAGISQRSTVTETSLEVDRKIMDINYFGNIALTKAVLPGMIKNKVGHIVVVSSLSGKFGFYLRSAYAASKHALHGFYESLRLEENNNGVKVTLLCPGPVRTSISVNAIDGKGKPTNKMDEMQEEGMPVEECVQKMIAAIKDEKKEVVIAKGAESVSVKIKSLFPDLFFKLLGKRDPRN